MYARAGALRGLPILGRCARLAVSAAPLALKNAKRMPAAMGMRAARPPLRPLSIVREVGSRPYRRALTRDYQMLAGSSGSARRFRVRFLLARWRPGSKLQKLLLLLLPLSLRQITS